MKFKLLSLLLVILILALSACQAGAPSPIASSSRLPLPQSVDDAVLVNFRPLTTTGRSLGATWSPDGQKLAYTELSVAPRLSSYRNSNNRPVTQVWEASPDGKDGHALDKGTVLFYSRDGTEIYYQQYDPTDNTPSVYAINPLTNQSRQFLGTKGFPNVTMLADGRLVLSEVSTYASLRIFNPSNGERQALMQTHPSNTPQDARLAPDGSLLAFSKSQAVYLSKPDGSAPQLLADNGGGFAKVWWSPDSQYLAYTTGNLESDKLLLADRRGKPKATLFPLLAENGFISSIVWSPDSRWLLVATESITPYSRPTRFYLFEKDGSHQFLFESNIAAAPAWSPDGHTLALSFWIAPQSVEPAFSIWLADLTDKKSAAALPATFPPQPQPTPTLLALTPDLAPDQVINHFWDNITQKDYHAAWSMLTLRQRGIESYPNFAAFYECMQNVSLTSAQPVNSDDKSAVFSVKINYRRDPDCNDNWKQANDFYANLARASSTAPWQIECFNDKPGCTTQ